MNSENSNRPRTGDSIQYVQLFLKMMFSQSNVKAKMILLEGHSNEQEKLEDDTFKNENE
jgi:hypothetical protein